MPQPDDICITFTIDVYVPADEWETMRNLCIEPGYTASHPDDDSYPPVFESDMFVNEIRSDMLDAACKATDHPVIGHYPVSKRVEPVTVLDPDSEEAF